MILAADSQESHGQDTKSLTGKISFKSSGSVETGELVSKTLAITGAGDSGYLSVLKQRIYDTILPLENVSEVQGELEGLIEDFYERHIVPFPPAQWGNLGVQLIVAASMRKEHGMWVTDMNSVRRVESFAAVGSGEAWSANLLRGFIPDLATEHSGCAIAAYSVFVAKDHSKECGKDTMIVSIPANGLVQMANRNALRRMENYFEEYEWAERSRRLITLGSISIGSTSANTDAVFRTLQVELAKLDLFAVPHQAKGQDSSNPSTSESSQT